MHTSRGEERMRTTYPPDSPLVGLLAVNRHLEQRLHPRWRDLIRREMWEFLGAIYARQGGERVPEFGAHVTVDLPPITGTAACGQMARDN
jgi:hypothetical protein